MVLVLSCVPGPAATADAPLTEYELKASFLLNFARFVEWPSEKFSAPGEPVVIAVVGADPFGRVLDEALAGKTASGRKIAVRRCRRPDEARAAHVVFVSRSERARLDWVLGRLRGHGVLTVGETADFAERGGIITFRVEGGRVRFDIAAERAERERLRLSSQLLKLAAGPEGS